MPDAAPPVGPPSAPIPPKPSRRTRPLPRTRFRRAFYSLLSVGIVLVVGTLGFHAIAGVDFVDAFYFESMLATGQGPPFPLSTDDAKIFASVMAFVSVGSVLTSVVFTLGPIFAHLWHEAAERVEREIRVVEEELEGDRPRR